MINETWLDNSSAISKNFQCIPVHVERNWEYMRAISKKVRQNLIQLLSNACNHGARHNLSGCGRSMDEGQDGRFRGPHTELDHFRKQKTNLFQEFTRRSLHSGSTRISLGTRNQLPVRPIDEGRISVESEPGQGSSYRIYCRPNHDRDRRRQRRRRSQDPPGHPLEDELGTWNHMR